MLSKSSDQFNIINSLISILSLKTSSSCNSVVKWNKERSFEPAVSPLSSKHNVWMKLQASAPHISRFAAYHQSILSCRIPVCIFSWSSAVDIVKEALLKTFQSLTFVWNMVETVDYWKSLLLSLDGHPFPFYETEMPLLNPGSRTRSFQFQLLSISLKLNLVFKVGLGNITKM